MPGRMHEVELVEDRDERAPARPGPPTDRRPPLRRSGRVVDVELDEGGPDEQRDAVRAARTWLRRRARWLLPAVAVTLGALLATQLVVNQREASRLAELAAIPGVVPPADPSIGVLWRADPGLGSVLRSGTLVDGLLVGGTQDDAGAAQIVGLDPDTGTVAWRTPVDLPAPQPAWTTSAPELWITCTTVPRGSDPVVGCTSHEFGEGVGGVPPSSVWVLDPDDGRVLSDRRLDGRTAMVFTDDALVVAERLPDDGTSTLGGARSARWTLTAHDVVTDAPLWTWTTPSTAVVDGDNGDDDFARESDPAGAPTLEAHPGHLLFAVDTRAWVLSTAGEPVLDAPLGSASWLQVARAGVFIESTWAPSSLYRGTLVLPDGDRVRVDETASWLSVDDGSAPEVVLTAGLTAGGPDGINGRSARTGERLWHVPGIVVSSLLLDGTVYVATTDALSAVDAATGEALWRTELDHEPEQMSTDGRYLLVPGPDITLDAFALHDGALAWTADLAQEVAGDRSPVFVQGFQAGWRDPRLYVWMNSGTVAVLG
ncbi:outer membrane protein assembly factor BamB family protein [Cellulomonas fengjieae]|uniref:outer membrane protein assembly factor BamB family protein n=1 Tax=Cellulomonas fengjieae TaxID=2819978 RepID=UPI001AAF1FCC|nr:PQQ-binding-like beta-propeller repeat protein [Cellulomonas fengjieae]MBO3100748.1 PQQ-binding-like beta-propeller repeat protein [Cellulomonas fengjieae]